MGERVFGNRLSENGFVLAFCGVLAISMAALFVSVNPTHEAWPARLGSGVLWGAALAAIPLAAVLATFFFSLRVSESEIAHMFIGRVCISSKPLDALESVHLAQGFWGARLDFGRKGSIRFVGARLDLLVDLSEHIESLRPGQVRLTSGAAAASLLSLGSWLTKRKPKKPPTR